VVPGHPVDACDHPRVEADPGAVEHADGDEADALRHAVDGAADRSGDVRAMAVAVVRGEAGSGRVGAVDGAAAELRVRLADAGVDDVGRHARTGVRVRVRAGERQVGLVDPVDPPRRVRLRRVDADGRVALDVCDARVGAQVVERAGRDEGRVALERVLVDEPDVDAEALGVLGGDGGRIRPARQDDDVPLRSGAAGGGSRQKRKRDEG
jgi:hypothetical protein